MQKLLFLLLLILSFQVYAFQDSPEDTVQYQWSLRAYTVYKTPAFRLKNTDNNSQVNYNPIQDISIGFGISYKLLLLDIGVSIEIDNRETDNENFDFQGALFMKHHYGRIYFQRYRGFVIDNSETSLGLPGGDPQSFRSDLSSQNLGVSYLRYKKGYNDHQFRAFRGDENAMKGWISPLWGAYFSRNVFIGNSGFIPDSLGSRFNREADFSSSRLLSVGINGGFAYSRHFVKNLFFGLAVTPGVGVAFGKYDFDQESYNVTSPQFHFEFFATLIYSMKRVYFTLSTINDYFWTDIKNDNQWFYSVNDYKFAIGYRVAGKKIYKF